MIEQISPLGKSLNHFVPKFVAYKLGAGKGSYGVQADDYMTAFYKPIFYKDINVLQIYPIVFHLPKT